MVYQHYRIPEQPTGYDLKPYNKGLWSVLEPIASTNLITNPSYETGLTGSVAFSGSETLTRDNTKQRYGIWSLKVVTSSSTQRGMVLNNGGPGFTLTAGKTYTLSVDAWLAGAVPYRLYVAGPSSSTPGSVTITGQGRWMRYVLTFVPTATGGHNINFIKDASSSTVPWYLDGWQLEALPYATTYLDGDQRGYPEDYIDLNGQAKPSPYQWLGTPHASQSRRLETTRHGGREWTFDSLGLSVLAYTGAGLPPVNIQDASLYFGGGSFQRKTRAIRNLTLLIAITTSGLMSLDRQIAKAEQLLNSDDGPVTLRYQKSDLSPVVDVPVVYEGGLEGNRDNLYQERIPISFRHYDSISERIDTTTPLSYSTNVTNANGLLLRDSTGQWQSMGSGVAGTLAALPVVTVETIVQAPSADYYIGGNFVTANGVTVNGIARWNGTTFSALGTGTNNTVRAIAIAADGTTVYAGGEGTSFGGVANTAYLARWTGSAWQSIGVVAGGPVYKLVIGTDGTLYAAGAFTSIGGVANTAYVAKYNGSTWSPIGGTAPNGYVNALAVDRLNNVYIGGVFTSVNSVPASRAAVWNGSSWSAMGLGFDDGPNDYEFGPDGRLYAGGAFTTADGRSANGVAAWNGSAWNTLGTGFTYNGAAGNVGNLFVAPNGDVYATGSFTQAGTSKLLEAVARWNGSMWLPLDVDIPGTNTLMTATGGGTDGTIIVGFAATGTAKSAVTNVPNNSLADAKPIVKFYGPGQVYQLHNYRTNQSIFFENLTLLDGEVMTVDMRWSSTLVNSNIRGNMKAYIGSGSNMSTWVLRPGNNNVSSFMGGTTNANTTIYMTYNSTYASLQEAQ